jgi:hypothetical protein
VQPVLCRNAPGGRPIPHHAVGSLFSVGDLQSLHAEQDGRRVLDQDALGFLTSYPVVGPEIIEAAGFRITAPRCGGGTSAERDTRQARKVKPY